MVDVLAPAADSVGSWQPCTLSGISSLPTPSGSWSTNASRIASYASSDMSFVSHVPARPVEINVFGVTFWRPERELVQHRPKPIQRCS
jgi:hypothetical protein